MEEVNGAGILTDLGHFAVTFWRRCCCLRRYLSSVGRRHDALHMDVNVESDWGKNRWG